jgi:hypothetical protein
LDTVRESIDTLREVVETLAPLSRRAGSPDERRAADWIAERLQAVGVPAEIEEELFDDGYAKELLPLGSAGLVAALLALSGSRRLLAGVVAALATVAIVDDVDNRKRVWRRLVAPTKTTWNVVARAGDADAEQTLIVLAHHDAAPTGRVFDPSLQEWLARRHPEVIKRSDTSPPIWWPAVGAGALSAAAALIGNRRLAAVAAALSALNVALGADIARSPVVPGANDNLSAVAALVLLAERLREEPVAGLQVLLASCGAEEVLQGGIYGFLARHGPALDRSRTWFLNLDTIGSPELILLEGEGCFVMEDYEDPAFRDLIARAADRTSGPLRRGVRARASSDSVVPSRAGYPVAMMASWDPVTKLPTNYHLMTDTPENLTYETIERAVSVAYAVAEDLASGAG